jgi:hypothetical protein
MGDVEDTSARLTTIDEEPAHRVAAALKDTSVAPPSVPVPLTSAVQSEFCGAGTAVETVSEGELSTSAPNVTGAAVAARLHPDAHE